MSIFRNMGDDNSFKALRSGFQISGISIILLLGKNFFSPTVRLIVKIYMIVVISKIIVKSLLLQTQNAFP